MTRWPRTRITGPGAASRGSALLVVLLMMTLIAGLTSVVGRAVNGAARDMQAMRVAEMKDRDLRGGIELAVAAIAALGPDVRSAQAAAELPGRRVTVAISNEAGRADINLADAELLAAVFEGAGISVAEAERLAANVVEWRGGVAGGRLTSEAGEDALGGAGLMDLQTQPGAELRQAPDQAVGTRYFLHPYQLATVKGFDRALVAKVLPYISVAGGSAKIDPYSAPRLVLAALPGVSGARVDAFVRAREGATSRDTGLALLGLSDDLADPEPSQSWRLEIRTETAGGRSYRSEAVIAVLSGDSRDYRVVYVRSQK